MAIDFDVKDVIHKIAVKFVHAFLPEAKKPYYLKAAHQPELDIHEIASKADVYNIGTSPKVIEEGLEAGFILMRYLTADGYKIKTPLFTLKIRVPGEYDGSETSLPTGVHAVARLQTSAEFSEYLKNHVQVEFDGLDESDGLIAQATDEATGLADEVLTKGNLLTVHGYGLKIEGDEAHKDGVGLYFTDGKGAVKAEIIAVNEPRMLKAIVPAGLTAGTRYNLVVVTQSLAKHGSGLLKNIREVKSEFSMTAQ